LLTAIDLAAQGCASLCAWVYDVVKVATGTCIIPYLHAIFAKHLLTSPILSHDSHVPGPPRVLPVLTEAYMSLTTTAVQSAKPWTTPSLSSVGKWKMRMGRKQLRLHVCVLRAALFCAACSLSYTAEIGWSDSTVSSFNICP